MTNKKQENKVDSFNFKGIITGTSNKLSEEFKNDNPRKTAFIKVDKSTENKLLENGLRMYTSKEGDDFFIIKLSEKVNAWVSGNPNPFEIATHVGTDNFSTEEPIYIACIKGKNKGNNYVRIYALGLATMDDIILVEQENPFGDIEGFQPTNNDSIPF